MKYVFVNETSLGEYLWVLRRYMMPCRGIDLSLQEGGLGARATTIHERDVFENAILLFFRFVHHKVLKEKTVKMS